MIKCYFFQSKNGKVECRKRSYSESYSHLHLLHFRETIIVKSVAFDFLFSNQIKITIEIFNLLFFHPAFKNEIQFSLIVLVSVVCAVTAQNPEG